MTEGAKVFWNCLALLAQSALGTLPDPGCEFLDVIEDLAPVCHFAEDFPLGVHHCRVIAAEGLADYFGQWLEG